MRVTIVQTGDFVVLKGDGFAVNGKQKGSVREETKAVSGTTVMSVQNPNQNHSILLSRQHKEVEVRREEGSSEVGVHLGSPIDSRAMTSCERYVHLISLWQLASSRMSLW